MARFAFWLSALAVIQAAHALRYLGRVNPATKELTWSATGLSFAFSGESATITFQGLTGSNSAELIVDGASTYIPDLEGDSISTPANLTYGYHTVEFRKSSEALFGSIFIGNVTTDGQFERDPVPTRRKRRKIEFIGDSITSAYGIAGAFPCTNTAALEVISQGYAVRAAKAFRADYSIISWSGIGIIRNYPSGTADSGPIMPVRYTRYGANDPDDSYPFPLTDRPDAVVINLGTNDFGHSDGRPLLSPADYTAALVSFVYTIQHMYGSKPVIFFMTSPLLGDAYPADEMQKTVQTLALYDAVAQLLWTTTAYVVHWPTQTSNVGCDYHPTADTNAIGAAALQSALAKVLKWA
ncbi:hypothetical protein ACEQ8H_004186 [Pleosporales sp. CAS-2024a]